MEDYILIAEDDNDINQMISELLSLNGYRYVQAFSGTEALLHVKSHPPVAVILDLMLPGMAGEEVLSRIKEESPETAVIVASAKESLDIRITLLKAGADDYLVKPFDTEELIARLGAVLRRSRRQEQAKALSGTSPGNYIRAEAETSKEKGEKRLQYKDITMYPENFSAFVGEQELFLTRREYLILELLLENPGKVFTKNNLYESVWNEEFLGEDNAVNVHISNIRQKLAKLRPQETYIQTVWGIGFKMK